MEEFKILPHSTIYALIEKKKFSTLKDILVVMQEADIADLFDSLPDKTVVPLLFRLLPKEMAAMTFVEMEADNQSLLIDGFSDNELKQVVDELYIDDAVDIVEEMPANVVGRILKQADPEKRKMINDILKYPDDTAGSIMTTELLDLRPQMTVDDAFKVIRSVGIKKETVNTCYVTDKNKYLVGVTTIFDLIIAEPTQLIEEIMEHNVISVNTLEDREDVANDMAKYNFSSMPVVDAENRLVGIITVDDALDVLQEEVTDDIEIMAAVTPSTKPYLKTSVFEIYKSRIPWLLLLMVSATFTGMIISGFESALASYVVLTSFIPMLMDTGGNSGSQASVTIIRGLSIDEIEFKDIFRILWKEIRVSLLCGATLSVVTFAKLMLFDRVGLTVSVVVCTTLFLTVFIAKVVGCSLPLLAKKIGFDPAVMASPFITTIVDAVSLLVYFSIARLLLNI